MTLRGGFCRRAWLLTGVVLLVGLSTGRTLRAADKLPFRGALRVCPTNPRYFTDDSGRAIYLTGSHTWNNLQDMGPTSPPAEFDFDKYLDFQDRHGHNFIRLWRWEALRWNTAANQAKTPHHHHVAPHPWMRTGPGLATDGLPKFDFSQFDESYFERLRERVEAARARGKYVSIMLFEGFALHYIPTSWEHHPFHPANNVSGIGQGVEEAEDVHTLAHPDITAVQEAYVRKVVATVNDLDNVLFEIANESGSYSTDWQRHMIRQVKAIEKGLPRQHPVGMTFQWSRDEAARGTLEALYESEADWISPGKDPRLPDPWIYAGNPPPADGRKVILVDTDHIWGIGGNPDWIWRSFLRGLNPIFMDPYEHRVLNRRADDEAQWESCRRAMGQTRRMAEQIDLPHMVPDRDSASTGYCLVNPGREYLVYRPNGGALEVTLPAGTYVAQWYNPTTDETVKQEAVEAMSEQTKFEPQFDGMAVLWLKRVETP